MKNEVEVKRRYVYDIHRCKKKKKIQHGSKKTKPTSKSLLLTNLCFNKTFRDMKLSRNAPKAPHKFSGDIPHVINLNPTINL